MEKIICSECFTEMEFISISHSLFLDEFFELYVCPCCDNEFKKIIKKVEN